MRIGHLYLAPGGAPVDYPGQRTKVIYPTPGTSVSYTYDRDGRMKTVTDWLGKQTEYTYDDAGRLTKTQYNLPSSVWTDYTYDPAGRLTNVANSKTGPVPISSFGYTLDAVGNRKTMQDSLGTHAYTYDALHRLTQADYPGPDIDTYTYDANGNRLTKTTPAGTTNYSYNPADQMTAAGGVTYVYDSAGNQTNRGSDSFQWDHENRLKQTTIASATATSTYNGDGLCLSHTTGAVTTNYVWDVAAGLSVVLEDGTNRYVYGLDLISATDGTGAQTYFLYDGLGSTTEVLNGADGSTVASYRYDAFGGIRAQTGASANYWLFTGEQRDGSEGLYYLRARYYDPAIGRFLSRDPVPGNLYRYANGNPVNFADPSGLCVPPEQGAVIAGATTATAGQSLGTTVVVGVGTAGTICVCNLTGACTAAVEGAVDIAGDAIDALGGFLSGGKKPIPTGKEYVEPRWEPSWLGVEVWYPGDFSNWTPPGWRCRDHLPAWFCMGAAPVAVSLSAGVYIWSLCADLIQSIVCRLSRKSSLARGSEAGWGREVGEAGNDDLSDSHSPAAPSTLVLGLCWIQKTRPSNGASGNDVANHFRSCHRRRDRG